MRQEQKNKCRHGHYHRWHEALFKPFIARRTGLNCYLLRRACMSGESERDRIEGRCPCPGAQFDARLASHRRSQKNMKGAKPGTKSCNCLMFYGGSLAPETGALPGCATPRWRIFHTSFHTKKVARSFVFSHTPPAAGNRRWCPASNGRNGARCDPPGAPPRSAGRPAGQRR